MSGQADPWYSKKKTETPFETFLKYSNEKEESSKKLASIIQKHIKAGSSILDVGTGNGEYLRLTLDKITDLPTIKLTLVEPSADLAQHLPALFTGNTTISIEGIEEFIASESFDIILAAHLFYHIRRTARPQVLRKMISMLKPGGVLIVVLREKDDWYEFKNKFGPQVHGQNFRALVLDNVLEGLPGDLSLDIKKESVHSLLHVPYEDNMDDTISIIEFFLNKQWSEIPPQIQHASLEFIKAKQGNFRQVDGIAVIQKPDVV